MKTNYVPVILTFFLAIGLFNTCYGQTGEILSSPDRNVILLTDHSVYNPGETISFSAIIPASGDNAPKGAGMLYIALIDIEGLEFGGRICEVKNRMTTGEILLPELLEEGLYLLVACPDQVKNMLPGQLFSRIIGVRTARTGYNIGMKLTDTVCKPGSLMSASLRFSDNEKQPVSVSYTYELSGTSSPVIQGKGKSEKDGSGKIEINLPAYSDSDNPKLTVTASFKGGKKSVSMVLPTSKNRVKTIGKQEAELTAAGQKQLNVNILNKIQQFNRDENVNTEVSVTDEKGAPVLATVSVSAYKTDEEMRALNADWSDLISKATEPLPQILSDVQPGGTEAVSIFNTGFRRLLAEYMTFIVHSPGKSYYVQDKNDMEKIKAVKPKPKAKTADYSAERSVLDILMRIKPYRLESNKIIFSSSGPNSLNNQDGAMIVIDGVKMGTDARVLENIQPVDVLKVTASTSPMDIQKYTALNSVGVVEVYTKTGANEFTGPPKDIVPESNSLIWKTGINTNIFGKASVSFVNDKLPGTVISVAVISADGQAGYSSVSLEGAPAQ